MPDDKQPTPSDGPNRTDDEAETRGGLEPEAFQRELIFVTASVLILGIVGGSCLGMKIHRAEKAQSKVDQTAPSSETPTETPRERAAPGGATN